MAENKTPKISIGITSMTVILCVLCLTVFSVLTLSTSLSEKEFAEKRVVATQNYYSAESEAAALVNELQILWEQEKDVYAFAEQSGIVVEGDLFRFQKSIDEGQELDVVLRLGDGFEVEVWRVVSTVDWTPDENLNVWDGLF